MTREHEMVSPTAPIPVGVFLGNHIDVIGDDSNQSTVKCVGVRPVVQEISYPLHAHRDKEGMGLVVMSGQKWAFATTVQLIDEMAFNRVDVGHRPIVKHGYLPFLVGPYLESFHHFYVTPAHPKLSKLNYFCIYFRL